MLPAPLLPRQEALVRCLESEASPHSRLSAPGPQQASQGAAVAAALLRAGAPRTKITKSRIPPSRHPHPDLSALLASAPRAAERRQQHGAELGLSPIPPTAQPGHWHGAEPQPSPRTRRPGQKEVPDRGTSHANPAAEVLCAPDAALGQILLPKEAFTGFPHKYRYPSACTRTAV